MLSRGLWPEEAEEEQILVFFFVRAAVELGDKSWTATRLLLSLKASALLPLDVFLWWLLAPPAPHSGGMRVQRWCAPATVDGVVVEVAVVVESMLAPSRYSSVVVVVLSIAGSVLLLRRERVLIRYAVFVVFLLSE